MAYPLIMRQRAIEALKNGYTKTEVNEIFGLSNNTLSSWEKLEMETGSLEKRPLNRSSVLVDLEELKKYCKENPFATHIEAGEHFGCSERVIRYNKKKLGITRKKRLYATQKETSKSESSS